MMTQPLPYNDVVERLRENDEMLRDGLQKSLTDAWHNEAMKQAAKDSAEAADLIVSLVSERDAGVDLLVRAQLNVSHIYVNWHHDTRLFLSTLNSGDGNGR